MSSLLPLPDPDFTVSNQNEQDDSLFFNVAAAVQEAQIFHDEFSATMEAGSKGITAAVQPVWAKQALRHRDPAEVILAKIGSRSFAKRNPEKTTEYGAYVKKCLASGSPLLFRIPVGPVKNMVRYGDCQIPDIAEYLMFMQLARFVAAIASLYPHGVKIQVVPDDVRARAANHCPDEYVHSYIGGLRRMVDALGFSAWLQVEDGQMRLCDLYKVSRYREQAETSLLQWKENEPERFTARWEAALENARKNFPAEKNENYETEIAASAWRYLIAHQSEMLSGMWSPIDAFPLIYAHHPHSYQLYSIGRKKTKLPWQIALPFDLLPREKIPAMLRNL